MAQKMQISDFLIDKSKKLFYLKNMKVLQKSPINFCRILQKKVYGRYFLAGTVGKP